MIDCDRQESTGSRPVNKRTVSQFLVIIIFVDPRACFLNQFVRLCKSYNLVVRLYVYLSLYQITVFLCLTPVRLGQGS